MAEPMLRVVLCWSLAPRQVHEMNLHVTAGSTVQSVLNQGIAQCLAVPSTKAADAPEAGLFDRAKLEGLHFQQAGIWGHKVSWTHPVQEGDRIELYRPLKVDPKVARRQRFKRQGKGRTGLFANRKSGVAAGY